MPPDHNVDDYVDAPAPHRHGGPLRVGLGGPVGSGKTVQTGCCPHTAIRDDITANLDAVELLESRHPGLELVLVESGGDNLTASFSYGLVDVQVFVVDVAGGGKVPPEGGPGGTPPDLLGGNKTG